MNIRKIGSKIVSLLMIFVMFAGGLINPTFVSADGSDNVNQSPLVTSFTVSPTEITHTGNIYVSVKFKGQAEDPNAADYIGAGKKIVIPISSLNGAEVVANSLMPQQEGFKTTFSSNMITIEFTDERKGQHDINGEVRFTLSGLNSEQDTQKQVDIGGKKVTITNTKGGERGVFAYKTGKMYGVDKPGYVTWYLSGNVNADANPGGPLVFEDTLGADQVLDGTGISIDLYWNGQQKQTYHQHFNSIESFLASEYGSGVGSEITYDKASGKIYIKIPEQVLRGVQFVFEYDALITNPDALKFYNTAKMTFYEDGKLDTRTDNVAVDNIDIGGYIYGKTRAYLNLNKVAGDEKTPVPGVTFEISREDGGKLYLNREETSIRLTTDDKGQIRESGFRPGVLIVREVGAPEYIAFNPQEQQKIELVANNKDQIETIENQVKTTSVSVEKKWVGPQKDSVTVNLLADNVQVATAELSAKTDWKHTFSALPAYDVKDGHRISYTIQEVNVDGYTSNISGDAQNGFTITNTISGKVSIPVTKKWVGPAASSVKVNLLADNKVVQSATLTADGNWQHTFTDLDQYKDGKAIVYTVSEEPVAGYQSAISGDAQNGFTITNTISGKVSIPVTKKWVGPAATSVKVNLLADNKVVQTATLTADSNWQHTFTDLDQYKDGKAIVYTVSEEPVAGYQSAISGDAQNGFTITNTISGKVSIPVTKKWVGPATSSVKVNLLADNKVVQTATLTADSNWQHTFTDLDQYKDGKAIVYTVSEEPVSGYKATISGNAAEGFTIVNTKEENKKELPKTGDTGSSLLMSLIGFFLMIAFGFYRRTLSDK